METKVGTPQTDAEQNMLTIADIVSQSGGEPDDNNQDFDILLTALQTAGLVDAVSDAEANLTVFAPTDAAFIQLANDLGFEGSDETGAVNAIVEALTALGNGDPVPVLQDILKYHISAGAKSLEKIQNAETISTLAGVALTPDGNSLIDNEPDIADASFISDLTDIQAGNSFIQGIDRVLLPVDLPGNDTPVEPPTDTPVEPPTDQPLPTIAEIVSQSGGEFDDNNQDFDILLTALKAADLVGAVSDPAADLTVFAPTDAAFIQLANDLGFEGSDETGAFDAIVGALTDLGNGDPIPVLQDVLKYHVSAGEKTLEEVQSSESIDTLLEGAILTPDGNSLIDNEPDVADASFAAQLTDIQAENGLIQGIDRVLIPLDIPGNDTPVEPPTDTPVEPPTDQPLPTIAEIVSQSGGEFDDNNQDFDILLTALKAADLVGAVSDPAADLTVFAPTDAAFIQLANDLGFEGSDETGAFDAIVGALTDLGNGDPIPVLQDVLKYHVSAGEKTLEEVQSSESIDTLLEGATLTPDGNSLIDNEPDVTDASFAAQLTDIQAGNGLIQGIDRVLIPLDIPGNENTGGKQTEIKGLSRNETLVADPSGSRIFGDHGKDTLVGSEAADFLNGENGDDTIEGNGGEDTLIGGGGRDTLLGGGQADILDGGNGTDTLSGNGGNDKLFGGRGKDILKGSADGEQFFDGGKGQDQLFLEGGKDTVVLRAGDGTDQIFGFDLGQTTLGLADGLKFGDLNFTQGDGFSSILKGNQTLATVDGVSASDLNSESLFTVL